jgi:glycine/D-amino acid oxidase-like deaminating enzyme
VPDRLPRTADAVVIGAGIVGAACAHYLAEAGLNVLVVDRGPVSGGSTGAGEGNILVSDKDPGAELDLALLSRALWAELADVLGDRSELERKGGLVVAATGSGHAALVRRAVEQRAAGVDVVDVAAADLRSYEPHLADGLAGGCFYPQDMQVQPMLAAALLLRRARDGGRVTVVTGCEVLDVARDAAGGITSVRTAGGTVATRVVVNAAGTWSGEVARLAGAYLPILPRRGFILVTEPLPVVVRHKVYTADYVDNVASDDAGLETSTVVEGTRAGTVLIGASRERVGFDRTLDWAVVARLAALAIEIFPVLAGVQLLRTYSGFRPYCPDHLPVIGPDPRVPGLFHACGHEGAGIGLAPASGLLVAQAATGSVTTLALEPFSPVRFEQVAHA